MARVGVTFDGSSRGAVAAATETVTAISKVRKAADEQARDNIVKRVEERRSLEQLAQQYRTVAENAKRGSEVQITAARLERNALRELADTHGVYVRQSQAGTASLAAHERELGKFTKGAVIGSGALGHLGRTAAIASGAFLGGAGVIQVFRSAVSDGSALQKQLERTTAVWNTNAGAVKAWSKDSATALGMARGDALDAANTIGTLLKNMDVAPGKALAMSKSITQLAADMAAFKGVKPEEALAALEAGLQGRTRSLKQFGIVLDQATIKQEAERLGLVKSTVDLGKVHDAELAVAIAKQKAADAAQKHGARSVEEAQALERVHSAERALATAEAGHAEKLTNEQKALATYNLLVKQTADQQGTWAKRSKDLAGQQQILHAQVKDLQEQLGTALIPQLTHYLPLLTGWIDRNEKNGTFQRDFNKIAKTTGDIVGGLVTVIKDVTHIFHLFGDAVGGDKQALELLAGVMVGAKLAGAFKTLVGGLGGVGAAAGEKGAAGQVGLLRSRLVGLNALSIAPIVIPIALAIGAREKDWLQKHLGKSMGGLAGVALDFGTGGAAGNPLADAWNAVSGGQGRPPAAGTTQKILQEAGAFSGGQYVWGGGHGGSETPNVARNRGLDCSGFISQVFAAAGFKGFAGTSQGLLALCQRGQGDNWYAQQVSASQVEAGDVAFANNAGHVGLVIGGKGASAKILAYSSPNAGGAGNGEKVDPMSSYWGPFYRIFLVDHSAAAGGPKNTSGMSNDPMHDAGANTASTTATPPKTGGTAGGGTGSFDTTFVEKAKVHKAKLTPLQRAVQAGQKSLAADIAQINDDVAKGLLPDSLGQMLDERARKLQKTLEHVTDPAKIKVLVADFRKTIETALKLPVDAARIAKDIASWQALVKEGLLPKSLQQALERRALELNAKLAKDLTNPAKYKADEQALRQLEEVGRRYADAFAKGVADEAQLVNVARQFREQLNQILGIAPNVNIGQLDQLARRLDAITWQLTHPKGLSKAQIGALQTEFGRLSQVYQNGLSQLATQIGDAKTAFEAAWTKLEDQQLQSFDEDTQAHLSAMQKSAQQTLAKLQVMVKGSFGSFMFGGDITQTPTERLIAQMQAQRQQQSDAQAISDAQAQLATDRTSGASASQLAADQKAVDDAVYQQKIDDLQKQADAERAAADKQLADAQQNFTDQETIAENAYQKQRDQQRQALQQQWDDEMKQVEEGKKPLAQALAELGDVAGAAFAGAYLLQLQTVYDSLQKLIDEANALADTTGSGTHIGPIFNPVPRQKKPANISGFATGGWAGHGSRTIDPRDTILARLRPGEYVMSPEEVAAGGPNWARGGGVSVAFPNATFIGAPTREAAEAWAPAIQAAIERHDLGGGMRVHR